MCTVILNHLLGPDKKMLLAQKVPCHNVEKKMHCTKHTCSKLDRIFTTMKAGIYHIFGHILIIFHWLILNPIMIIPKDG